MSFDPTAGGAAANSYLTVEAATDLLSTRPGKTVWIDATLEDKQSALIEATGEIDANRFHGYKWTREQRLQFPRDEQDVDPPAIPLDIQKACAYQALHMLTNWSTGGKDERQALQSSGVSSFRIGNFGETFRQGAEQQNGLCGDANRRLRGWISRTGQHVGPREEAWDGRPRYGWPFDGVR